MSHDALKQIEMLLGRRLEPDLAESIKALNDIPGKYLEEARLLSPMLRYIFLQYYIDPSLYRKLPQFIEEVMEKGVEQQSEANGRILVPAFSVKELIIRDVTSIIAPLQPEVTEAWQRLIPDRTLWDAYEFITGAPAVLRLHLEPGWAAPEHVMDVLLDDSVKIEAVGDIFIATRRWIGANVAGAAKRRQLLGVLWEPHILINQMYPEAHQLSKDAEIAIAAMLSEIRYLESNELEIPGFRGPDEWYVGNIP
jgi:hypothetical protein